jgi:membrane glycosyltransferase
LRGRRRLVLALALATYAGLALAAGRVAAAGGWTVVDALMLAGLLVAAPWTVLGFWNAALGLRLLHGAREGLGQVAPHLAAGEGREPPRLRTAVLMTLRNEDRPGPSRGSRWWRRASRRRATAGASRTSC